MSNVLRPPSRSPFTSHKPQAEAPIPREELLMRLSLLLASCRAALECSGCRANPDDRSDAPLAADGPTLIG